MLAWLRGRSPAPPPALAGQLVTCVERAPDDAFDAATVAEVTGRLGIATLRTAVQRQAVAHDGAMDLLAADALVTYAFEAAAEGGEQVTALVRRLLAEVR